MSDSVPGEVEREFIVESEAATESGSPTDLNESGGRAMVVQSTVVIWVKLQFSPEGESTFTQEEVFSPFEAQQFAGQLRTGDTAFFFQDPPNNDLAGRLATAIEQAVRLGQTMMMEDIAGKDVIDAYRDGKVTAEETAHEIEREIDKSFEDTPPEQCR